MCSPGTGLYLPRSSSRCRARLYPSGLNINSNNNAPLVTNVNTEQDLLKHDNSIMGNDNDIETVLLWGEPNCRITLYNLNYNPSATSNKRNIVTHDNVNNVINSGAQKKCKTKAGNNINTYLSLIHI